MPPRSCLGYSLIQLLFILKKAGLLSSTFDTRANFTIRNCAYKKRCLDYSIQKKVRLATAVKLVGKLVAIYSIAGKEGLAIRFRQQLNENSKVLGWSNVIPEMTHNEIVGWRAENKNVAVVFCYANDDF